MIFNLTNRSMCDSVCSTKLKNKNEKMTEIEKINEITDYLHFLGYLVEIEYCINDNSIIREFHVYDELTGYKSLSTKYLEALENFADNCI